jgi:hypothetical protein
MQVGPFSLETGLGTWRIIAASDLAESGVTIPADTWTARLAAEDAARALVADMAAALGGTVAWPAEGGE